MRCASLKKENGAYTYERDEKSACVRATICMYHVVLSRASFCRRVVRSVARGHSGRAVGVVFATFEGVDVTPKGWEMGLGNGHCLRIHASPVFQQNLKLRKALMGDENDGTRSGVHGTGMSWEKE